MGWYKKTIGDYISILASKEEVKQKALEQLGGGISPAQVAQEFVLNMMKEDPAFPASQILPLRNDAVALTNFLNGLDVTPSTPVIPDSASTAPQLPLIPGTSVTPTEPSQLRSEETPVGPGGGADKGEVTPETIQGRPEEKGHVVDDEGEAILTDVTNQMERAPDPNEKITMDPTIQGSYEIPVAGVSRLRKKLDGINRKLRRRFHPEIKVEFEGDPYNKPITYRNRTTPVMEPFVRVKLSGTLPSPSELLSARIKEPIISKRGPNKGQIVYEEDGKTPKMRMIGEEPIGVRFIAKVHHHPLSKEEQDEYLKNEPPDSYLRKIITECQKEGTIPFFNTIEALEKDFPIDAKFRYSRPQDCYACKVRHARKSAYIGAVVPPEQMIHKKIMKRQDDGTMKEEIAMTEEQDKTTGRVRRVPVKIIPEELVKSAPQEQFGGACADKTEMVQTIDNLKKWIDKLKEAEKEHKEKAKAKKYTGGTRGDLPAAHLFASAINMIRDPQYAGNLKRVTWDLPLVAKAYGTYLKQKEQEAKGEPTRTPFNYRRRYIPRIEDYDKDLAFKIRAWWRAKLGGIDLDLADSNKVSLSVLPTIGAYTGIKQGRDNIKNVVEMVQTYLDANNIQLEPLPKPKPKPEPVKPRPNAFGPTRFRNTEPGTPLPPPPPPVPPPVPPEPEITQLEGPTPPNPVDIRTVPKHGDFVSKFKFKESRPWRRGGGISHYFLDDAGKKYVIFERDKYVEEAGGRTRVPHQEFEGGKEYYLKGKKGDYNGRYHTTTLNDASKWEQPAAPEEDTTRLGEPVEAKPPSNLPSWYGKHDLGQLAEDRIRNKRRRDGQPSTTKETIKAFLDRMADITDKWKQPRYRQGEEFTLNQLVKPQYGGEDALIAKLKEIYERDRPKI